ncbi:ComEC/Rec2 family competence protein [Kordia jejudonensis]|uniref:ComEC/Rec2 family competence protein n=1 Tax=Kordia jejudonensis TaxID=1348245 RepID=UPI000629077F|nr:ComEC/Rec2 family competence protein [Kordia jejudonensis]
MKLFDFLITKLTLCLVFGILIGYYFSISVSISNYCFCIGFLLSCIFFWKAQRQFLQTIYFGIIVFLTAISLGIVIENFHQEKNHITHYTKFLTDESEVSNYTIQIREVLKSTKYYDRYIGEVLWKDRLQVSGKLLMHVQKDSVPKILNVDDYLHTNISLKTVRSPLNPTNFDYKTYLNDRYIFHQLYLKTNDFISTKNVSKTIYGYAASVRNQIHKSLVACNFKNDELAVIEALLLGQRQQISKELQTQYANAGAIHILAISGLHIGIIVLLLNFLLKPMTNFRHGKFLKLILMICILWSFAVISGLSASVVRAVTMFTAIVIATYFKRQTNTFQVLIISMFFLLICKPHFLFDVGFQLSYAAVFAIVWLQPLWKKLWNPKRWILKSFWSLLTVSLSAQLGVLPLSLYYFHQFPGLFFVANLTIIPVLGIILILGIAVIILAYFEVLPEFLGVLYSFVIQQMNHFIAWIASHEQFLLAEIFISLPQILGCYLVIIAFANYFHLPKGKHLKLAFASILICQAIWFFDRYQHVPTNSSFAVFHQHKTSVVAYQDGAALHIFHTLDSIAFAKNYVVQQQRSQRFLTSFTNDSLQNVYRLQDDYLLRIDSLGVYESLNFEPKYVLLTQSPRINLERMIATLKPELIIADGSNYTSYVKRWKEVARKQKIPFHATYEKGFLSIDLK